MQNKTIPESIKPHPFRNFHRKALEGIRMNYIKKNS